VNAELYRRARDVFVHAIELEQQDRASFLDVECGGDAELRSEVDSLLAAHSVKRGFGSVAAPIREAGARPELEAVRFPERIGTYKILDVLGEGGMGVVYLAEQESPRRTVALKVLHAGFASPARIRRLQHEAQILGRLHHPGIAQVYEAGSADAGAGPRPFLSMELVEGRILSDHADAARLDTTARVRLLVQVCLAVHHAHERGVIHRDLKPANILVDEHGTPKVLDFGIARATADDLRTITALTGAGEVLGTLPYMSPEQIEGDPADVDARADVYALGVVGYELLSGRLPIDVGGRSLPEAARAIRDEEPTPLGSLDRALRGDLETIFAKALSKERGRRYVSALELARDLQHWLAQEPIVARPASTMYQLAKFARRNRVLVGGIAGVFVALLLGLAGTGWQAVVANREKLQALEAQHDAEVAQGVASSEAARAREAEKSARAEADRVRSAYQFIEDTLRSADPKELGREVKVVDVLERMAARIGHAFASDAESEATVRHTIGLTYFILGRLAEAEENLRRSYELFKGVAGPRSRRTADAEYMLGRAVMGLGRLGEAGILLRESRDIVRETDGPSSYNASAIGKYLAETLWKTGRLDEAESMLRELAGAGSLPESDPLVIECVAELGIVLKNEGRLEEASTDLERAVRLQEAATGPEDRETLHYLGELASLRISQGKPAEAEAILRRIWEAKKRMLGEDRPDTVTALNNLAVAIARQGRLDEACTLWREVLELRRRVLGDTHPNTFATKVCLMNVAAQQGRDEEAEALSAEVLHDIPGLDGGECVETIFARTDIARRRLGQGREADAEALAREAFELGRDRMHLDPRMLAEQGELLGACLLRLERFEEAEARLKECAEVRSAAFGDGDPRTRTSLELLRDLYRRWEKPEKESEIAQRLGSGR
jgi:serine/threonine protein kinase/TolA-binding protein